MTIDTCGFFWFVWEEHDLRNQGKVISFHRTREGAYAKMNILTYGRSIYNYKVRLGIMEG